MLIDVMLWTILSVQQSEAYSSPCQTSKKEPFAKRINDEKPFTIFAKKNFILDVCQSSEYASDNGYSSP